MKKVFVIYSRKSKYTGKGESIENQIEMCREYIRVHYGLKEANDAVVFEDEGFSGGNLDRPQFKKMMEASKNGEYRGIVVYRLDRISRNIGDFANLINDLSKAEIDFISVKEQFDTGSPMGRAMMYISSVFSQLERETIAERIRDNLHELAKTGRWLGGTTPTGYGSENIVTVTVEGKQKKACMLKVIPEEMCIVEAIYSQFLRLRSLTKLDAFLLKHGFRTKRGNEYTRFAIKAILTNPVYMIADEAAYEYLAGQKVQLYAERDEFDNTHGIMAYNRTQQEKGKAHKEKPMEEWIVAVGKHQGRIPGSMWVEVQNVLEQNRSKNYKQPRSNVALLSGVLKCGNCGDYMRPKLGRRTLDSGERIYSYLCAKKERSRRSCCAIKNVEGNILDEELVQQLTELDEEKSVFLTELEKGKKSICESVPCYTDYISNIEKEISVNDEKIDRLVKTLSLASQGTEQYILAQIEEMSKKNHQLKAQNTELKMSGSGQTGYKQFGCSMAESSMEFDLLAQRVQSLADMREILSVQQKRDLIRTLVKEVVWDGEDAHVILLGSNYEFQLPENPVVCKESVSEPLREDSK